MRKISKNKRVAKIGFFRIWLIERKGRNGHKTLKQPLEIEQINHYSFEKIGFSENSCFFANGVNINSNH
jgi:hypothetical protein